MILSRQVNLFLEENTIFIIGAISEISKNYETKKSSKNEEVVNEKIRDILEGGEMSQIGDTSISANNLYQDNRQQDIKKEIRSGGILSETKVNNFNFENKKREVLESKNIRDIKVIENNRKLERKEEVIKSLSYIPVSIKDIAEKVLGCSEKTIQRELNNLVDEKRVNRIGEKRWSKYVLA
jgi:alpha-L-fucosidase